MKKTFKLLVLAVAALPLGAGLTCLGQSYSGRMQVSYFTNALNANLTTVVNLGTTNKVKNYEDISLEFRQQGDATGDVSNTVVTIVRSLDGINFETWPGIVWNVPASGTNAVTGHTNLDRTVIGASGYWKVLSVQNPHATINLTNCALFWSTKGIRFGP